MHKDPQKRVDIRKTPGKLTLMVFALFVIVALCCDYMLLSVRQGEASAVSGELIQGGYGSVPSSVWGRLFEYFGSVTYLFPLLALFPVWWILRSGLSIKNIDFFRLGLRLVGFNVLVLGLCMLYTGILGADSNDAGGYVGIGLYQFVFASLPRVGAALLIIAMTFVGMMLFTAHGPIWYCDHLGSAITAWWPFGRKNAKEQEAQEPEDESKTATDAKAPLETFQTVSAAKAQDADSQDADFQERSKARGFVPPRFFKGKAEADARITMGHAPGERVEPSFGGVSSSVPQSAPEPAPAPAPAQVPPQSAAPAHRYIGDAARQTELDMWGEGKRDMQRASVQDETAAPQEPEPEYQGPSTIISGGAYATPVPEEEPQGYPEDEYVMPDAPSSTIITKAGETYGSADAPADAPTQEKSSETSGPNYQAGAPGIDSDVVGNPYRRSTVSTVITRHDPAQDLQFDQQVKGGQSADHADGYYTEKDSGAYIPSSPGTLMDDRCEAADVPGYFSFEQDHKSESTDAEENVPETPARPPRPQSSAPISEHDSSYLGSFGRATRGLADPQPVELPSSENFPGEDDTEEFAGSAHDYDGYAADVPAQDDFFPDDTPEDVTGDHDYAPQSHEDHAPSRSAVEPQEAPHAPLGRVPTKTYVSSVTTVPSGSDPHDNWRPPFDLLTPPKQSEMVDQATIDAMIVKINKALADFGVQAEVASYLAGPVITRYDLRLGRGTRVSAIRQLQLDLARTLTTAQVRVLDVVPGTPYSGLEIPNPKRKIITLREVVETEEFAHTGAGLPLCIGVNATGAPVVADLAKAPHLLIAGTTGSGKSAGINSMLASLLLTRSPSELRMILVDPKQVEFALYEDLPHLICPVISEPSQTMAALQWCVGEMERRYKLISGLKLRSIGEVNKYIESENAQGRAVYDPAWTADMGGSPAVLKPIPSIVMVIDEFADLMDAFRAKPKSNRGIQPDVLVGRLAQKARAAGIHLMLATQSPRSQVITGTLKANLPSRIAFTVQSGLDSRVILDESGAETLLGNGDMLAKLMGLMNNQLFRAHGPFTSNEDVQAVVNAWHEHCGSPEFLEGVTDVEDEDEGEDASFGGDPQPSRRKDLLYDQVVAYARDYQNAHDGADPSITGIQMEFGIGYPRAKRLVMDMKKNGDLRDD